MSYARHKHDQSKHPVKGLLDGAPTVRFNTGEGFVDAIVLHEGDGKNLVLGRFINNTFQLVNDGNPVTERAEKDYGPEGGGLTWTH